jgi:hypothetical protein
VLGQFVLVIVVAVYAAGILWLRRLARFETPQRLLAGPSPVMAPASLVESGVSAPGGQG